MPRCFSSLPILASVLLGLMLLGSEASSQEVGLVPLDNNQTKEIAKGYRAELLKLKAVRNDNGEMIGHIDDFIFGHESPDIFAVLSVGEFIGLGNHLVAVPFEVSSSTIPPASSCFRAPARQLCRSCPCFSTISRSPGLSFKAMLHEAPGDRGDFLLSFVVGPNSG